MEFLYISSPWHFLHYTINSIILLLNNAVAARARSKMSIQKYITYATLIISYIEGTFVIPYIIIYCTTHKVACSYLSMQSVSQYERCKLPLPLLIASHNNIQFIQRCSKLLGISYYILSYILVLLLSKILTGWYLNTS